MFRAGLILGVCFVCGIEGLGFFVEDAYFKEVNPEYLDTDVTVLEVVWVNDTCSGIASNISLIKDAPKDTTAHFDLWLKSMGEYKTHSGITANLPWCTMLEEPVLIGNIGRALGMSSENCPQPPGFYGTDFWTPTTELMPDYFPGTDYKVTFALMSKKTVLFNAWVFISLF